jgi:hypothetical protein
MNLKDPHALEPEPLPSVDALIAGTVALMTAWADPCPDAPVGPGHPRQLIARKVVSNLFFLQHHPCVGSALRQTLVNAHGKWVGLAVRDPQDAQAETAQEVRRGEPGQALH